VKVLIVGQDEVPRLLPMPECIAAMQQAFAALARGEALNPLRQVVALRAGHGVLASMPAEAGHLGVAGLKAITVVPGNHATPLDSHQGVVLLFEAEHGRLLAVVDATSLTAIRTAAVSGLATRLLAREDAGDLAILGSGVQARTHLEAMALVRRLRRVRVFSRQPARLEAFAKAASARHALPVEATASARDAVLGADIVCSVTSSPVPVLKGEWLAAGAHVNAVGASLPSCRELDTAAVARASLFVDRRESALSEAGDFLFPKQEGVIGDDHIKGEIGELLLGRVTGRRSQDEVTLFKSLGLAVEDVAAAHLVYQRADDDGSGTWLDLGGSRRA
jgi:ornithine cyclodeaminase/alanine dehydrogenase-like protein (mu-crystallin family)